MQTLRQNTITQRLPLIVAGRRVVQPLHVRTLRVSQPFGADPTSSDPQPSKPSSPEIRNDVDHSPSVPREPGSSGPRKRGSRELLPYLTRAVMTRTRRKLKFTQAMPPPIPPAQSVSRKQVPGGKSRTRNSGKDAPPPPTEPPAAPTRSSGRAFPPHYIPYMRRTQGYVSDGADPDSNVLRDVDPPSEHKPIAQLAHGLERVLFNPGVYWLRDPRSRIYNFTPWLESIPTVTDFAFERVTGFVKSSMDDDLWKIAKQYKRRFAGSTSSLTGLLGHCYFLISGNKEVDTSSLSRAFLHQPANFTPGQRMPTSVVLNYKEGVWSIDSDKVEEVAEKNVLTWLGTMLEIFLTASEEEFKTFLRSAPVIEEDTDTRRQAYRYAMSEQFIMRSQLDCVDPRLPGTGVFDIKTRAAVPIRVDLLNYEENSGYLIKTLTGPLESFEKEYYDLIRSAFLKYSFQARIGNMDGVLIAYHNTARIFGFQYIPLEEMEERLYGGPGSGARVFNKCVPLLERVLNEVVSIYGERSVKCTFETRELSHELNVWIEPVDWDEAVEGKPLPITELNVRVTNYLDGERVRGSRAVADSRSWMIHWMVTQSGLEEVEIRRRLESARNRQINAALNFPSGVETMDEMEKVWVKIDFGAKQSAQEMAATMKESGSHPKPEDAVSHEHFVGEEDTLESVSSQDGSDTACASSPDEATREMDDFAPFDSPSPVPSPSSSVHPLPFPSPFIAFRKPDKRIKQLRQLALQGREETMREESQGREKVVLDATDDWREARESDHLADGDTLPAADEKTLGR